MKGKSVCVGVVLAVTFALCAVASAQVPGQLKLRGEINDYTPVTTGGPWEMHGEWSLHVLKQVDGQPQVAEFSAEVDMERSDYGVMVNGMNDFSDPVGRHAHTHHITLNGEVTGLLRDKNNAVIGFEVKGVATITGNGNPPPDFDPLTNLTIDITGGTLVKYSNLKLTFGTSPSNPPAHGASAVDHFGPYALNGVVKSID
ncbi:MAG TPA: hypothetical protein VFU86_06150 [Terriglobales bacterium]|nr:hypothetical protein [Terriglobales bacterium]